MATDFVPQEHTVLFVDLLGFGALVEEFPDEVVEATDGGYHEVSSSPSLDRLSTFSSRVHTIVENAAQFSGSLQAFLFSDCAFICLGTPLRTCRFAIHLMQELLSAAVTVRMGIGYGTFSQQLFSSETRGKTVITRSLFMGTAVVRAARAEGKGTGCRIFLHKSCAPILSDITALPLFPVEDNSVADWEIGYLFEGRHLGIPALVHDERLMRGIKEAHHQSGSSKGRLFEQYLTTFAALNRMRVKEGRTPFDFSDEENS